MYNRMPVYIQTHMRNGLAIMSFLPNEGGYEFIAGHLRFMDSSMQVPETSLYENWLEAWNTDNKWNNGSAGSIATAYTWRAYNTMAKLA